MTGFREGNAPLRAVTYAKSRHGAARSSRWRGRGLRWNGVRRLGFTEILFAFASCTANNGYPGIR